jgi:hypothetical protein
MRIIGPKMSSVLGQSIIVENKPGAGGLVGTNAMSIINSYSTANVSTVNATSWVGGLVGVSGKKPDNFNGEISTSYSTGRVSGVTGSKLGTLVGLLNGSTITNSYSLSDVYIGGALVTPKNVVGEISGSGLNTSGSNLTSSSFSLQSSFSGFDFNNVWVMGATQPVLRQFPTSIYLLVLSGQSSTYGSSPSSLSYCYSLLASSCSNVNVSGIPNDSKLFNLTGGAVSESVSIDNGVSGTISLGGASSIASSGISNSTNWS